MTYKFDSFGGYTELSSRDGSTCVVVRPLTEDEVDIDDVGRMYRVRFSDGYETDAFADELS